MTTATPPGLNQITRIGTNWHLLASGDFNGDNRADLLWQSDDGTIVDWTMDGAQIQAGTILGSLGDDWQLLAAADLDGDGTADLLWQSRSTGLIVDWTMQNGRVASGAIVAALDADWTLLAAADFDGDHRADLLWQSRSTGLIVNWTMDGARIASSTIVAALGTDWHFRAAADFNGDGRADLLWQHDTGLIVDWTMDGASIQAGTIVGALGAEWQFLGAGDLNGDNRADLLWRDTAGTVVGWTMDGPTITAGARLGDMDATWTLRALGDANGDGRTDMVWQNDAGAVAISLAPGPPAPPMASLAQTAAPPPPEPPPPPPPPPPPGANGDVGLVAVGAPSYAAGSRVLTVGAGKQFATIAAAIGASGDGDVVLVDAGTYTNDFATTYTKISLLAVGGRVTMLATLPPPNWKGILTVETDLRVEGFDFVGCRIPDEYGHNGAGIRQEGGALTLVNDQFLRNQNGILTAGVNGPTSISIDHSLFDGNGGPDGNGAGNIHNIYIGHTDSAVVTNSVFQNALVGHEFKSRAVINTLTNNLFISGVGSGTGSYDIDLPNGGQALLSHNTIVKGPNAENSFMVHFGGEGIPYAGSSLDLDDNRFVSTNPNAGGLLNHTATTAHLAGNQLDGLSIDALLRGPARATGTTDTAGAPIADATLTGVLPGSTAIFTDGAAHAITVGEHGITMVQGGAGRLTAAIAVGHIVLVGGAGGMDVTENDWTGGNQYTTAAGSQNTLRMHGVGQNAIDSEGTDLIDPGAGNQTGVLNGTATVLAGAGNNGWSVDGAATIDTGSGSTTVALGAHGQLALSGTNDWWALNSNGGAARYDTTNADRPVSGSITDGAIQAQTYEGRLRATTAAGGTGATLRLDHGDATILSAGPDTIWAGDGDITVITSGRAQIHAGTGALAVFGRGSLGAHVYAAGGTVLLDGDSGNITYHGGTQDNALRLALSRCTVLGGAGQLTITGGMAERIVGGAGGIVLHEAGGGGNDITTAAGSTNLLDLSNPGHVSSHGTDTITTAAGNFRVEIYGDSTLSLGSGNSQVTLGGHDTVHVAGGSNRFTVLAGGDVAFDVHGLTTIHSDGRVSLASGGGTVTVSGGTADLRAEPGASLAVETTGQAPVRIDAGAGPLRVRSAGADQIHLADSAARVDVIGSGANIWAGAGALAVQGWGGGHDFTVHGGTGSIVANTGNDAMRFIGGAGVAALEVAGGATIAFGTGQTQVRSYDGAANLFTVAEPGGTGTIDGFRPGTDHVSLAATQSVTAGSAGSASGGAWHALLNDGTTLTFTGLTSSQNLFG